MARRTSTIILRVTPEERATITAAAADRTLSAYIRAAVLAAAAKEPHMPAAIEDEGTLTPAQAAAARRIIE